MEAVTKRRETDARVQKIIRKNLPFISEKLSAKGVIEYLYEKGVLTLRNYKQLNLNLGRIENSDVIRILFLDILYYKENYWVHTVKAIRTCEPCSSVADLIESVLPEDERRRLERWCQRHGIHKQEEDSHCSSDTDSYMGTSSLAGTDSDSDTKRKLYQGKPCRIQKVGSGYGSKKHRTTIDVKGGPTHRRNGHRPERNENNYYAQNGLNLGLRKNHSVDHVPCDHLPYTGYKVPAGNDNMRSHLRDSGRFRQKMGNTEPIWHTHSSVNQQPHEYHGEGEFFSHGQQMLWPLQQGDYDTTYRKNDNLPPNLLSLDIPSPKILPNPPNTGRNEHPLDGSTDTATGIRYQSTEGNGGNDSTHFETSGQAMSVNACDSGKRDRQQNATDQKSGIDRISEMMESQCKIETDDEPESSSAMDSGETDSSQSEYTESESESTEMGSYIPLPSARPPSLPTHYRNLPQAPTAPYGFQQQMPAPGIQQPITGWKLTPTLMHQGFQPQPYFVMRSNLPGPQAYMPAFPLNYAHQPVAGFNPNLMNQQQGTHLLPQTQPVSMPGTNDILASQAVEQTVTFTTPVVGLNQTFMNQQQVAQQTQLQQTQSEQPATITRTVNSVEGAESEGSASKKNKEQSQDCSLPAASNLPGSQTEHQKHISTETISKIEEYNADVSRKEAEQTSQIIPTPKSEPAICRGTQVDDETPSTAFNTEATSSRSTKTEALETKNAQIDATSFKDTTPETMVSTHALTEVMSSEGYRTFETESISSRVDERTQADNGFSEAALSKDSEDYKRETAIFHTDSRTQVSESAMPVRIIVSDQTTSIDDPGDMYDSLD